MKQRLNEMATLAAARELLKFGKTRSSQAVHKRARALPNKDQRIVYPMIEFPDEFKDLPSGVDMAREFEAHQDEYAEDEDNKFRPAFDEDDKARQKAFRAFGDSVVKELTPFLCPALFIRIMADFTGEGIRGLVRFGRLHRWTTIKYKDLHSVFKRYNMELGATTKEISHLLAGHHQDYPRTPEAADISLDFLYRAMESNIGSFEPNFNIHLSVKNGEFVMPEALHEPEGFKAVVGKINNARAALFSKTTKYNKEKESPDFISHPRYQEMIRTKYELEKKWRENPMGEDRRHYIRDNMPDEDLLALFDMATAHSRIHKKLQADTVKETEGMARRAVKNDYYLLFSTNPLDIVRMSDGTNWTSCTRAALEERLSNSTVTDMVNDMMRDREDPEKVREIIKSYSTRMASAPGTYVHKMFYDIIHGSVIVFVLSENMVDRRPDGSLRATINGISPHMRFMLKREMPNDSNGDNKFQYVFESAAYGELPRDCPYSEEQIKQNIAFRATKELNLDLSIGKATHGSSLYPGVYSDNKNDYDTSEAKAERDSMTAKELVDSSMWKKENQEYFLKKFRDTAYEEFRYEISPKDHATIRVSGIGELGTKYIQSKYGAPFVDVDLCKLIDDDNYDDVISVSSPSFGIHYSDITGYMESPDNPYEETLSLDMKGLCDVFDNRFMSDFYVEYKEFEEEMSEA